MSIYGLGNMGINWVENVPINAKNALLLAISKNIEVTLQKDENLQKMNNKVKKRTSTNKNSKIDTNSDINSNKNMRINPHDGVDDSQIGMTLQGVSNILYGLSSMKLMWSDLTIELKDKIITILIFLLQNSLHQKPHTQIIPKFIEKKNNDNIWKNKNKGIERIDIRNSINNDDNNINDDNKNTNTNLSIEILDVVNSRDFRFLLNSMAAIKIDFTDSIDVPSSSSQSSISLLKVEKLKEILLTLFIQFASQDDLENRVTINHEKDNDEDDDDDYRILNNKLFHRVMTIKDFFVCIKSLGKTR